MVGVAGARAADRWCRNVGVVVLPPRATARQCYAVDGSPVLDFHKFNGLNLFGCTGHGVHGTKPSAHETSQAVSAEVQPRRSPNLTWSRVRMPQRRVSGHSHSVRYRTRRQSTIDAHRAANPFVTLHCPYCPLELAYERTEGEAHLDHCPQCGPLLLPPDGRIHRVLPESETRH